jgi:hypothetical protein
MSRQDQFAGLPYEAEIFLRKNEKLPIVCPACNCIQPFKLAVIDSYYVGMFGDEYDLHQYQLNEGYADEFVQAAPWSGGPVFFLGLHVYDKNGVLRQSFLWSEDDINNA